MKLAVALLVSVAFAGAVEPEPVRTEPALKDVFRGKFSIGMAADNPQGARAVLLLHHANTMTPENAMKFYTVRPEPGVWNWEKADHSVNFATANGLEIVGHTLVWCYQMPGWVKDRIDSGALDKAAALDLQDDHIQKVMARYKDRVKTWDVVNEALADGPGPELLRSDPWSDLCGVDYVVEAFRSARRADPEAKLLYNDYNLDFPEKRTRLFRLLALLKEQGVRVDGVGIQGHMQVSRPRLAELETAIVKIHAAGYPVHITELDLDVYSRGEGADVRRIESGEETGYAELPDELQARLAECYADLFRVFVKHADKIERVTFWNVDDGNTWLNNWPVKGRRNHPLLFDRAQRPKPAFWKVVANADAAVSDTPVNSR